MPIESANCRIRGEEKSRQARYPQETGSFAFHSHSIAIFVRLTGHRRQAGHGKGNAAAAANSFQAREGATGVIGHNLVDSLIYKQSLMKFLVFINNALQPRAPVCRHRYPGIPFSLTLPLLSPSVSLVHHHLLLLLLHPFYTLPFSYSYSAASARTIVRHPLSPWLSTNPRFSHHRNVLDEPTRQYVTHCRGGCIRTLIRSCQRISALYLLLCSHLN